MGREAVLLGGEKVFHFVKNSRLSVLLDVRCAVRCNVVAAASEAAIARTTHARAHTRRHMSILEHPRILKHPRTKNALFEMSSARHAHEKFRGHGSGGREERKKKRGGGGVPRTGERARVHKHSDTRLSAPRNTTQGKECNGDAGLADLLSEDETALLRCVRASSGVSERGWVTAVKHCEQFVLRLGTLIQIWSRGQTPLGYRSSKP